jgi:hypothetical protein
MDRSFFLSKISVRRSTPHFRARQNGKQHAEDDRQARPYDLHEGICEVPEHNSKPRLAEKFARAEADSFQQNPPFTV